MRALRAFAIAEVVAVVFLTGAAADFDVYSRTAYALGVMASTFAFLVADFLIRLGGRDDNRTS